jgi:hypothetical protein
LHMGVQYYWCKMCWIDFFIWNQWIKYKLWRWVSSERHSEPCWIWQQNTRCCALLDPFRFYTVCHYKNALNTFLMSLIALIILLISLIGCLKFHMFMFAMPIAQGNVFKSATLVKIYFKTLHDYPIVSTCYVQGE